MDKIRCYVIADDYKWHILTDSLEEFKIISESYLNLMAKSDKENNYYFKNIFLTRKEFIDGLKMMAQSKNKSKIQPKTTIKRPHLQLV